VQNSEKVGPKDKCLV